MSIKNNILNKFLPLNLILIIIITLTYSSLGQSFGNAFLAFAQNINTTQDVNMSFAAGNHSVLSLIPLMIKEIQNTNATTIPIKQVINATPSNVTALQNIAKDNVINNLSKLAINSQNGTINTTQNNSLNTAISTNNNNNNNNNSINNNTLSSPNKTKSLIPLVVNLTKKTNATDIAMAKTINATPSNVTALQNIAKGNIINKVNNITSDTLNLANSKRVLNAPNGTINTTQNNSLNTAISTNNNNNNNNNSINNNTLSSPNKTKSLIPLVVNLTKKTNATDIAMAKTINATPSNVTALQNIAKGNIINKVNNVNNGLSR